MFVRPLAYKGPNDHLSRFFSDECLFSALKNLLDNPLSDWQHDNHTQRVEAKVFDQQTACHVEISWPLTEDGQHCSCELAKPCHHIAALALESKCRLHEIVYPLKEFSSAQHALKTVQQWLDHQSFDPYPNMARHRLVYLLKEQDGQCWVSLYKAYLTQDNKYVLKEKFDFHGINFSKLQKFVSLADQSILYRIHQIPESHDASDRSHFLLNNTTAADIFCDMLRTGRCFYKASSRPPLKFDTLAQLPVDSDVISIDSDTLVFDRSHNRVIKNHQAEKQNKTLNESPDTVKPRLVLSTDEIHFPWRPKQTFTIDYGNIWFDGFRNHEPIGEFQWDAMKAIQHSLSEDIKESIAFYLKQIEGIPTLSSAYELPIVQQYDSSTRHLSMDFSHLAVWLLGCHHAGWQIEFANAYHLHSKSADDWYLHVDDHDDWFELELGVDVDGQKVNIMPHLVQAIRAGKIDLKQRDVKEDLAIRLSNGETILLAPHRLNAILQTLVELFEKKPLNQSDRLKLAKSHITRLNQLKQTQGTIELSGNQHLFRLGENLAKSNGIQPIVPASILRAELRDYQLHGLRWLNFLFQHEVCGVLADDMGLGKTLQTIAFICHLKVTQQLNHPVLVVAPTSLLANWQRELEKFAPSLKAMTYYGAQREKVSDQLQHQDVIITSYGTLLREVTGLAKMDFTLVVLDEAQTIKNARTQMAKSTYALKSRSRLCLSGTPMENHLGEIWSLFHFLMPGFLGTEAQFNRLFRKPIEKEGDRQLEKSLAQRISPFLLRRTKDKVAKELPAKTEVEQIIELDQSQADLYEAIRLSMAEEVQKAMQQSGAGKNNMLIGNALLRLRQVCCHPKLISLSAAQSTTESAKIQWLTTVLPEMIEEGRRILIFSSFTSMLDLIASELKNLQIDFLTLTGKTRHRGDLVETFQTGTVPVFLISLKAGGSGLNLTAADTVIHFDPWWNPAAEDQASDRVHRIGQDKPVFVYKLITRGTVEERILKLQRHKSALAQSLYEEAGENTESMEADDWLSLFSPIE